MTCSFAGKEPYLGPQDDPVPGVHNSAWVPSPGLKRVTDRAVWLDLEKYVRDIVGHFKDDRRVLIWDLYNEPGNTWQFWTGDGESADDGWDSLQGPAVVLNEWQHLAMGRTGKTFPVFLEIPPAQVR